jgi:hypothetical protein
VDRFDHVRIAGQRLAGNSLVFQLNWEDLTGGGDRDFDDVVMSLRAMPS